jgi:hypothetical protein
MTRQLPSWTRWNEVPILSERRELLAEFYSVLGTLRERVGGDQRLSACHGRLGWPMQGVYFFFENGELRENGQTLRVVRVETHAISTGSKTTLWNRLAQHNGQTAGSRGGGGNHRGSIFRLLVGEALLSAGRDAYGDVSSWGKGSSAARATREGEHPLEKAVSQHIGRMPFLWLAVCDGPGRESDRRLIEENSIALLSNRNRTPIDPPSPGWLGRESLRTEIRDRCFGTSDTSTRCLIRRSSRFCAATPTRRTHLDTANETVGAVFAAAIFRRRQNEMHGLAVTRSFNQSQCVAQRHAKRA